MSEAVMKEAAHPPRTIRSVGAVLTGIIVGVLLTIITDVVLHAIGVYPASAQPMVNAIVAACNRLSRCLRCVGGCISARLAPDRPMRHALAGRRGLCGVHRWRSGNVEPWAGLWAALVSAGTRRHGGTVRMAGWPTARNAIWAIRWTPATEVKSALWPFRNRLLRSRRGKDSYIHAPCA